jgi:hypothetical protein
MSGSEVAASYSLYAAYCFEAARGTSEPGRRLALLNMAQAWTELADHAQKFRGENDLDDNDRPGSGSSLQAQLTRAAFKDSAKSRHRG